MSIRAKKSLGQHFLRSKTALAQIIDAAKLSSRTLYLKSVLAKELSQKH